MNTAKAEKITPRWHAVKIDESRFCSPDFLERCGGGVFQVYLVNLAEVTYCCEITPSYCLIPVDLVAKEYPDEDVPGGEERRNALYEELLEVNNQADVQYMHCSDFDRTVPAEDRHDLTPRLDLEDLEDGDTGEDVARENYQGNPVW